MQRIIKEWQDCDKIKIFEFRVIDNRDRSEDWVTFDIDIIDGCFVARHDALNQQQRNSKFISSVKTTIDPDFSLDKNLMELYEACIETLAESEFYSMAEEE